MYIDLLSGKRRNKQLNCSFNCYYIVCRMVIINIKKVEARIATTNKTNQKMISLFSIYVLLVNLVKKQSAYNWMPILFFVTLLVPNEAYSEIWIEEVQQAELPLALLPTGSKNIVLDNNSS